MELNSERRTGLQVRILTFYSQLSFLIVVATHIALTPLDFNHLICNIRRRTIACQLQKGHYANGIRGLRKHLANGKSAHKSEAFLLDLHHSKE